MDKNKLKQLAIAYLRGDASEEEKQQLHRWYDENTNLEEEFINIESDETQEQIRQRILATIKEKAGLTNKLNKAKVVSLYSRRWMRIAAAFLVISAGTASYLILRNTSSTDAGNTVIAMQNENDILPGKNKASLTLANGDVIILDSAGVGKLAQQGNTIIMNSDGKLVYTGEDLPENQPMYNTLTTARGEVYPLILSDGSRVWLNAESSIRFPVSFTGQERSVQITGEAFFEVAGNKQNPFTVNVSGASIQVLGTQFNVMAYNNEAMVKTTLLEGSVKFMKGGENIQLRPGEQSQLSINGEIKVVTNVDVKKEVAWKDGYFDFEGSDFETIAKQLSRWYDVEVKNAQMVNEQFYAKISRDTKLSVVLKALELTGKVNFEINDRNIIVKP